MRIGAYSPEIKLQPLESVFSEAHRLGFTQLQYDFSTSHGEDMPEEFFPGELEQISSTSKAFCIEIIAINGTFNMIDLNLEKRSEYVRRFERIAEACKYLNCKIITLCTGSRSQKSMWSYHPDSASDVAWQDLVGTTKQTLRIAERYEVFLGVETEASNVIFSVDRARKFLDEMNSPWLKVIMDCANLFPTGTARVENVRRTIQKAFDLLGRDIILAHGKDVCESDSIQFTSPGRGIVDYDLYFQLLKEYNYARGFILHGIHAHHDFEPSIAFIKDKLDQVGP